MGNPVIPRRKPLTARVGIYGVGHHVYWPQFEGLLDQMKQKLSVFEQKVGGSGVEVFNFGIADNAGSAYTIRIVNAVITVAGLVLFRRPSMRLPIRPKGNP